MPADNSTSLPPSDPPGADVLCPVCQYPTIGQRGGYFICRLCDWEDDDTNELDELSGPNGDYTIREARKNFQKDLTMYRPDDPRFEGSRRRNHLKRVFMALIDAYRIERQGSQRTVTFRARVLWKQALFTLRIF